MMGKRKRPKKKPLTQEEIWDDSALVQSWDDAVEEYNLYHSIQARGESVDEVLRAEDARIRAEDEATFGEHAAEDPPHAHPVAEFESVDEEANDQDMEMEAGTDSHGAQQEASSAKKSPEANRTAGGGFATMPQLVSQGDDASSADKALKNLMMAWYFAGYYTGLYEGQQRGANQHS
ncbi:SMN domain-containing protein [Histoplasma capsulatum var. duboisii H88]|uniref:SMN domain-containing protein n=3 Tax=Ajellomyces capsulatus TaxID=5037 RepID=A0A8A1LAW7_AJEC8|nr:SMN domain-containing protein [Histoplasma capsulatum var. duboisii H88]